MSVIDKEIVDGMAVDNDEKALRLLITDHLDWDEEYKHLIILQENINAYIAFCEERQYESVVNNAEIRYVIFEIHFRCEPTANCISFLEQVQRQLSELGIKIKCHISEGK